MIRHALRLQSIDLLYFGQPQIVILATFPYLQKIIRTVFLSSWVSDVLSARIRTSLYRIDCLKLSLQDQRVYQAGRSDYRRTWTHGFLRNSGLRTPHFRMSVFLQEMKTGTCEPLVLFKLFEVDWLVFVKQWQIQYFQCDRWVQTLKMGTQSYLTKFSRKLHEHEKHLTQRGGKSH